MVCPCCGAHQTTTATECACGAKSVGLPLTEPDWVAPKLGFAFASIILGLAGLLMFWIKPVGLIALGGVYLAYKGLQLHKANPARFGGLRLARTGLAVSIIMVCLDGGLMIASIPKAIRAYHGRRYYSTVANMQELAGLLREYQREYGSLPEELNDLRLITAKPINNIDFWEQEFRFTSTSLVASRGPRHEPLTTYEIRSAGPDGLFGTADDIIMQDGRIIPPADTDPALKEAAPVESITPAEREPGKGSRKR